VPAELIKFFAMQEIYPTELFQDSRDGNIYYAPRCHDPTGLKSPQRFNRTYFSHIPASVMNLLPAVVQDPKLFPNQLLHRFKKESTSIGLKSNIVVRGSSVYSEQSTSDFNVHLRTKPHSLKNQPFACKVSIYQDETITSAVEAGVVAFNVARFFGRETRAATAVMVGDPSLVPGEICQVVDNFSRTGTPEEFAAKILKDRQDFEEFNGRIDKFVAEAAEKAAAATAAGSTDKTFKITLPDDSKLNVTTLASDPSTGTVKASPEALICEKSSYISSGDDNVIGFNAEPDSMWRVEAIIHNYNSGTPGYTTEVAWSSPF